MASLLHAPLKRFASVVDRVRPTDGLVVLIYHRVGARTPVSVDLPTGLFAEQMRFLAERYRPVTMDEAAELLAGGAEAVDARPPVVVTFDDGTADFVDEALPVLTEHRVPATVYLATSHIDEGLDFPDDGRPMSWSAAAEAVASGFVTVGSHTHRHLLLDRVPPDVAATDLDRSIALIEDRLGVACRHFAYPKALLASPAVEPEVRRRFDTAVIAGTRPNPWGDTDLHRIARSPIQTTDGLRWFEQKALGGMGFEDDVRAVVNRLRHRRAET